MARHVVKLSFACFLYLMCLFNLSVLFVEIILCIVGPYILIRMMVGFSMESTGMYSETESPEELSTLWMVLSLGTTIFLIFVVLPILWSGGVC